MYSQPSKAGCGVSAAILRSYYCNVLIPVECIDYGTDACHHSLEDISALYKTDLSFSILDGVLNDF
jgi:hypothetical protein